MTSRLMNLSKEQRHVIRRHAKRKQVTTREPVVRTRYQIGDRIEEGVTIEPFPGTVYTEVPTVRRYRYFRDHDDVMLVDPDEDRVAKIIR